MSPSMKESFGHHHRLTEPERESLWKSCVFALDANCLLNIYRYAEATRTDLFRVLDKLKGRIWIPYQAAKEFYANRVEVIREQKRKYDDLEAELNDTLSQLRSGSYRKSAFLMIEELEGILRPAIDKAKEGIARRRAEHPDLLHDDRYVEQLASIVGSAIGSEPDQKQIDELCIKAQDRIEKQVPPGYRDAKKPAPERYGDVLIWFELLEHARQVNKPIVLVTDDEKEDWWQIVGGQKLGPRPELREEMRKTSKVEFYLINPAYFLEVAGGQVQVNIAQSSVDDAQKVTAEIQEKVARDTERVKAVSAVHADTVNPYSVSDPFSKLSRIAVRRWIRRQEGSSHISHLGLPTIEYIVRRLDEYTIGVQILPMLYQAPLVKTLKNAFIEAQLQIDSNLIDEFCLFIVAASVEIASSLIERLHRAQLEIVGCLSIGTIGGSHGYVELHRFQAPESQAFRRRIGSALHSPDGTAREIRAHNDADPRISE